MNKTPQSFEEVSKQISKMYEDASKAYLQHIEKASAEFLAAVSPKKDPEPNQEPITLMPEQYKQFSELLDRLSVAIEGLSDLLK